MDRPFFSELLIRHQRDRSRGLVVERGVGVRDVAGEAQNVARVDVSLGSFRARSEPALREQYVLDDALGVRVRVARLTGREEDLERLDQTCAGGLGEHL